MILRNICLACGAAVLLSICISDAQGLDPAAEARWRYPYKPDYPCAAPRRIYGFYPTKWRQWPGATFGELVPAAAEPEAVPAPPPVEPELEMPEEGGVVPTPVPPGVSPFGDQDPAPMPPGGTGFGEPGVAPELDSTLPQPGIDVEELFRSTDQPDATIPVEPEEPRGIENDPFQDDPDQPPTQPQPTPNSGGQLPGNAAPVSAVRATAPDTIRWRSAGLTEKRSEVPALSPPTSLPALNQPTVEPRKFDAPEATMAIEQPAKPTAAVTNPLRSGSAARTVVTTAGWSRETGPVRATVRPSLRANPLRAQ